ncbi:MAG: chromate resistance protein [Rhodobacteraceae bacterium]|nr:chromate resistance protein [Paracoccaceae bacterium]
MAQFNEITPAALMRLIGTPVAPRLIDVCIDDDFAEDPRLIPTSKRVPYLEIAQACAGAARIVVICQKGKKLSHGAAALLRTQGIEAEVLEGGIHGWRDAGLPLTPAAALRGKLWVTRHRPKIDRIACPWLLRRFVDPRAEVMFVPPKEVMAVAERFGATAFDCPNAPFRDADQKSSFDALLAEFQLYIPALNKVADMVRAADLDDLAAEPQAAGLLAASVGFSKMFKNDHEQMEATFPLYDALYRWARDGQAETHSHREGAA